MSLSRLVLSLILLLFSFATYSRQKNKPVENFFALNAQSKLTTLDSAKYIIHEIQINDTCMQWDIYNLLGPLVKTEIYKDTNASIEHGEFVYYKPNGRIDSICPYANGKAEGTWYFYDSANKVFLKKEFSQGKLLKITDVRKEDSLKAAQKDTATSYRIEIESVFKGGFNSWQRYLTKSLKYPDRAVNNNIEGEVIVQFVVDTEGNTEDISIFKSVEFSLDEEAKRIIRTSPKWTPGVRDGVKVKTYKRQPIKFGIY